MDLSRRLGLLILCLTFAAASSTSQAAPPPAGGKGGGSSNNKAYTLVRLAYPGAAAASTEGRDLNDDGNVVGTYKDGNAIQHGFYFEGASKIYTSLGAGVTVAGINQLDELVGTDNIENRGLYWSSPTALPMLLEPLAEHTHSLAVAINNAGIIIGSSYIPEDEPVTPEFRAIVVWRVNQAGAISAPLVLPFPAGDLLGVARDLTEDDDGITLIVGDTGDTNTYPSNAVQWSVILDNAGMPHLLTGPTILTSHYAYGQSINRFGDVVGAAVFAANTSQWPYLKTMDEALIPLPGISKATYGSANSINDFGMIVGDQGYLSRGSLIRLAVLWPNSSTVVDLNSQVTLDRSETLTNARRINNRGDILAWINGTSKRSCLLIAR